MKEWKLKMAQLIKSIRENQDVKYEAFQDFLVNVLGAVSDTLDSIDVEISEEEAAEIFDENILYGRKFGKN